jgi:hypothetical protein
MDFCPPWREMGGVVKEPANVVDAVHDAPMVPSVELPMQIAIYSLLFVIFGL